MVTLHLYTGAPELYPNNPRPKLGMLVLWAVSMKAKEFTLEGSCDGHGWIRSTSK